MDILGYSGAIAALAFGITLGNLDSFKISRILPIIQDVPQVELHPAEKIFLAQLVQLLKTFFFIYIGLSVVISGIESLIIGCLIVLILLTIRIVVVNYSVSRTIPKRDASIMAIMIPKGLAAAVLAAIPLQRGVPDGLFIETTTYAIILYSIVFCSALVILIEKTPVKKMYNRIFSKFGQDSSTPVPP